uniref:EF-hand domain-containing protein n=1 Tax=Candidatus Kentrum sp. FW TaxID=2126338 RepID=A0A450S392_9GAMM|nr:MAG: hypothetical protein BECKFW1821A_GA0114235_101226 [Candidatus Kentron sp. FW]
MYTRFLIRGIRTGQVDRDQDGTITIGELHDYARHKVQEIQPAMRPEIYPGREGYAIRIVRVSMGDPMEKYAGEVAQVMDHRGEISSVVARANELRQRFQARISPTSRSGSTSSTCSPDS